MAADTSPRFVHLHLHSQYSLLDGGNRLDLLIKRVKALGMDAVAVTDHGNLFGAAEFYQKATAAGIKPILGIEAYVAPDLLGKPSDRTCRESTGEADGGFHLVLLAETQQGWQHLLKLSSDAYLQGFYYKPRMDKTTLRQWGEGLIAINGHLGSSLAYHLTQYVRTDQEKHFEIALAEAQWHAQTFGPNAQGDPCFYIELQRHSVKDQIDINPHLVRLAQTLGLPLVADNDAHFLLEEDWDIHDTLCCISMGKLKSDASRMRYSQDLFVKSPAEMAAAFAGEDCEVPREQALEALENTVRIADRCNVQLDTSANHAPVVRVVRMPPGKGRNNHPPGSNEWYSLLCGSFQLLPYEGHGADAERDKLNTQCDQALRELTEAGALWRYGPEGITDAIRARIERELKILSDKYISAYFLIVWDFVNEARRRGIPCNARGSGVGTMVGYCLALSNACPVQYGLLFERFTDPDRSEYPDIDIDICQDGRQEIIEYVRQKYGHVAQIITFNVLKAKQAVRDVGRVMDMTITQVNDVCKLIGDVLNTTLESALAQEPALRRQYDQNPSVRQLLDSARKLEGMARHTGVHAAGVIVATEPLDNIVPLARATGGKGEDIQIVTQWDGPTCEKFGLLKMDFLGLRTLSIIERARQLVLETLPAKTIRRTVDEGRRQHGLAEIPGIVDPLDLDRLTYDDPNVFEVFQRGETAGVFQFESEGMRNLLVAMKPDRLEDLIAANALYRPGPMALIPDYNDRKHGRARVPQMHPIVDRYTQETYGIMVYQEQIMQILHDLGDVPLREAYSIIKAISKKKESVINATRARFIEGAAKKSLDKGKANELFDLILKFAGYGFNKSHSTGYAIVAYQTAFLKAYFPVHYMAALLTYEAESNEKVVQYIEACRQVRRRDGRRGVDVRPPDVNLSDIGFTVTYDPGETRTADAGHIRFGLTAVKGVGTKAVQAILDGRAAEEEAKAAVEKDGRARPGKAQVVPFTSLYDFCQRVSLHAVNRSTIDALIKCGAFDSVHGIDRRAAMIDALDDAIRGGQRAARDRHSGQSSFFDMFASADPAPQAQSGHDVNLPTVEPWDKATLLGHERQVLGFYLTSHPLKNHQTLIERYTSCSLADCQRLAGETPLTVAGMVMQQRTVMTRKNEKMAILTLNDGSDAMPCVLFPRTFATQYAALEGGEDAILFVVGKLDRKKENPQIIVDQLVPLEQVIARLTQTVLIQVTDPREVGLAPLNGELQALQEVLRQASHGGNGQSSVRAGVVVELQHADQAIALELGDCQVRPSRQLIDSVHTVLNTADRQIARCMLLGPQRYHLDETHRHLLHDDADSEAAALFARTQAAAGQTHQEDETCASIDRY